MVGSLRPLAPVLLVVLLAGCLEPPLAAQDDDAPGEDAPSGTRVATELLHRHVDLPGPGPHAFDVPVPAGGATSVSWTLTVEGVVRSTSTVTGSGCNGGVGNVQVQIGGSSTSSGPCADLGAGTSTITVNLTDPALGFTVFIHGHVVAA